MEWLFALHVDILAIGKHSEPFTSNASEIRNVSFLEASRRFSFVKGFIVDLFGVKVLF